MNDGKWTKNPPGGDVCFVFDRDGLAEFIKHTQELADEARKIGGPAPQETTVPRVAQRFVLPNGVHWLVAGSEKLWPEAQLRKRVVWYSKPVNMPRISFVIAKEIKTDEARRHEAEDRRSDDPAREPGAGEGAG